MQRQRLCDTLIEERRTGTSPYREWDDREQQPAVVICQMSPSARPTSTASRRDVTPSLR
jgi:hypothetical protein